VAAVGPPETREPGCGYPALRAAAGRGRRWCASWRTHRNGMIAIVRMRGRAGDDNGRRGEHE